MNKKLIIGVLCAGLSVASVQSATQQDIAKTMYGLKTAIAANVLGAGLTGACGALSLQAAWYLSVTHRYNDQLVTGWDNEKFICQLKRDIKHAKANAVPYASFEDELRARRRLRPVGFLRNADFLYSKEALYGCALAAGAFGLGTLMWNMKMILSNRSNGLSLADDVELQKY